MYDGEVQLVFVVVAVVVISSKLAFKRDETIDPVPWLWKKGNKRTTPYVTLQVNLYTSTLSDKTLSHAFQMYNFKCKIWNRMVCG